MCISPEVLQQFLQQSQGQSQMSASNGPMQLPPGVMPPSMSAPAMPGAAPAANLFGKAPC